MFTMSTATEQIVLAALALLCACIAAVYDVREHRIPNRLTGPCLAAGVLVHFAIRGWAGVGSSLFAASIAGAIFLLFFLAGGMGAGDVKLMAAIGAILGLPPLELALLATVIAGGVLALGLAGYHGRLRATLGNAAMLVLHHGQRGLQPHPELNLGNAATLRLPFALPVSAGCLVTLCVFALGAHA